eukprot:COSAG03_NODE_10126_length_670_cov_1.931699_2_plen_66_part_00
MATQDEADARAEAEAEQRVKAVTWAEKALYKGWEVLEDYIHADGNAGDTLLSQRPCITWLNSLFS